MSHRRQPVSTGMVTFHTLLDLAGVHSHVLRKQHALGSPQFTPMHRRYVNDHNELVSIDSCGLKRLDFEQFHAHGLKL